MRGHVRDATSVVETALPGPRGLVLTYAPARNGAPDPGEIVWAWVPYAEGAANGKDRPLLVLGRRDDEHCWAMKLTSRSRDGDRDHLPLGAGSWDASGRPSWLDIDQIYLVHRYGIRREAGELGRTRFRSVAQALSKRYGWSLAR